MPIYPYICDECGHAEEVVKSMSASNSVETCPECFQPMRQDIAAKGLRAHADSYHTPIHSDALRVSSKQWDEHRRLYPDVPLDRVGRPVLSNYKQHEKYLAGRGVVKHPQKARRRGKRI